MSEIIEGWVARRKQRMAEADKTQEEIETWEAKYRKNAARRAANLSACCGKPLDDSALAPSPWDPEEPKSLHGPIYCSACRRLHSWV